MVHFKLAIFLAAACSLAAAFPAADEPTKQENAVDKVYRLVQECGDKDMSMCLKMRALTFMDSVLHEGDITVTDGVVLRQSGSKSGRAMSQAELESNLPANQEERSTQVDSLLVDRVAKFLHTHTLQFKLPETAIEDMKRSIDEGRKKKKKFLLPLLMIVGLKAAALIPLVLGGLALLAFKALIVSKIALALSAIVGLKKLLSGGQGHSTSYEVVSHPHHDEHHHDEHHHGRANEQDAQDIAYRAHAQ